MERFHHSRGARVGHIDKQTHLVMMSVHEEQLAWRRHHILRVMRLRGLHAGRRRRDHFGEVSAVRTQIENSEKVAISLILIAREQDQVRRFCAGLGLPIANRSGAGDDSQARGYCTHSHRELSKTPRLGMMPTSVPSRDVIVIGVSV